MPCHAIDGMDLGAWREKRPNQAPPNRPERRHPKRRQRPNMHPNDIRRRPPRNTKENFIFRVTRNGIHSNVSPGVDIRVLQGPRYDVRIEVPETLAHSWG